MPPTPGRQAELDARRNALLKELATLTGNQGSEAFCQEQRQTLEAWDTWAAACRQPPRPKGTGKPWKPSPPAWRIPR